MVTKIYHAKLIYDGLIQNGAYVHWSYIYKYSSKEDELEGMPILVQYFVVTSTILVAWWWVNSWWCSSVSRIEFAIKASFVVTWNLTQENKKTRKQITFQC